MRPVDDDLETVLDSLGDRLRALRDQRAMSLARVSGATGISISTLSRLESGGRRATLALLLPLARLYGVTLDELVDAPAMGDPRLNFPVRRHGDRIMLPLSTSTGAIEASKLIVPARPAGAVPEEPDPRVHKGFAWMYLLRGRLRVVLGDLDFELAPGEIAEFSTKVPHWFVNIGDVDAECIMLSGRNGERPVVRARPRTNATR
jgi:transcriptional regulator with XRE-family HTH domain